MIDALLVLTKLWPDRQWEIVMIGPEMQLPSDEIVQLARHPGLTVWGCKATGHRFLQAPNSSLAAPHLLVLFNSGVGTKLAPVMQSWLPTLAAFRAAQIPMAFFCFNEAELEGEREVHS